VTLEEFLERLPADVKARDLRDVVRVILQVEQDGMPGEIRFQLRERVWKPARRAAALQEPRCP
jgi:hypothetical protein